MKLLLFNILFIPEKNLFELNKSSKFMISEMSEKYLQ